jgi:periplasmic protein TonB
MEDTLQPPGAAQHMLPNNYLVIGIAASIILHLACVVVLLGLPSGTRGPSTSVTYVDLNAAQRPAPMTAPARETPPAKAVQEPPSNPVHESRPQAQQSEALPTQTAPALGTAKVEEQLPLSTMGMGLTKGYFQSIGNGETLNVGIKGYYLEMLQGINEKWWVDQQIDKRHLAPVTVILTVARSGEIIGCEILRGSGNKRYDKAVLAALAAAGPLPPLPAQYVGDSFQAPIRLVPPLNLMAW